MNEILDVDNVNSDTNYPTTEKEEPKPQPLPPPPTNKKKN